MPLVYPQSFLPTQGSYRALEWTESKQAYSENAELGIVVQVVVRLI